MTKLKPCPFCGGEAVTRMECEPRRTMRPYGTFYTECRSCGASVGFAFVDAEDAKKAWNRRSKEVTNDLISRQAAIDELNGQIEYCDKALRAFDIAVNDAYAVKVERASLIAYKDQLESIPAADVVPVVRCDDCVYYGSRRWCELHSSVFDDNAFCSYGERKEA